MFVDHPFKTQTGIRPDQPCQDHDLFAHLRISLVGHGAAAYLPHLKRLFYLPGLTSGQAPDFISDLGQGSRDHGHC